MTATLRPATTSSSSSSLSRSDGEAILRAIETRRSAPAWLPDELDRATIARLVQAANHAPNHKLTQPWRFFVLRRDARLEYASALASDQIAFQQGNDPIAGHASNASKMSAEWQARCREAVAQNLLRAPIVIAAGCVPAQLPDLPDWEELAATAAAVQNLLLAAHALGLGAAWKSRSCPLPGAVEWLGLPSHAQLLGHILLGYADPAIEPKPKVRRSHDELTTWLGWDG